jgi:hypothetical protein
VIWQLAVTGPCGAGVRVFIMKKRLLLLNIIAPCLMICAALPARAVDVSTHCFTNCGLPDSGQKICYAAIGAGGEIPCPAPGEALAQDGSYMPGAAQPSYTEYKVNGSLVTVDNRTGLMWITDPSGAGMGGKYTWEGALSECEGQTYSGYTDWRLPNIRELESMVDYSKISGPTINVTYFPGTQGTQPAYYWASTTYTQDASYAWVVNFAKGYVYNDDKANSNYVRCVRGGP